MAATWFSRVLGDGIDAHDPSTRILSAFLPVFAAAGQPLDMAVFSCYALESNLVTIYFSPAAANLALTYGATPCDTPRSAGLSLLAGDQRAWDFLFPEGISKSRIAGD